MLINEPSIEREDPILSMIAEVNGNSTKVRTERTGIYFIGHFGSSDFPRGYERYPEFNEDRPHDSETVWRNAYGVCDNVDQLLAHFPELENDPKRQFVVTLTEVLKANQSASGGWRWHKWGPYIGTFNSQCEYLADEVGIDRVFVYHIYEKKEL